MGTLLRTWMIVFLVMAGGAGRAAAEQVTVDYVGFIATVAGTPFGLDASARLATVGGSITYETNTPDTNPNPQVGDYPHAFGGGFRAEFLGRVVTGSPTPFAQVEDLTFGMFQTDVFRYIDGGPSALMALDGVPNPNITLFIAMVDSFGNAFSSDALPDTFPFASGPPFTYGHTFVVSDSSGSLLFQLNSVAQRPAVIPEPASAVLMVTGLIMGSAWLGLRARSRRPGMR